MNMGIRANPRLPWISFLSQTALLYSQLLLLTVILGVLTFHYAWGQHHRSYGLFVLTYFPESSFFRHMPCQGWVVRVESNEKWYLNSKRIEPDDLLEALRVQLGRRTNMRSTKAKDYRGRRGFAGTVEVRCDAR